MTAERRCSQSRPPCIWGRAEELSTAQNLHLSAVSKTHFSGWRIQNAVTSFWKSFINRIWGEKHGGVLERTGVLNKILQNPTCLRRRLISGLVTSMAAEPAAKLKLWDRKVDSTLPAATHKHLTYYHKCFMCYQFFQNQPQTDNYNAEWMKPFLNGNIWILWVGHGWILNSRALQPPQPKLAAHST